MIRLSISHKLMLAFLGLTLVVLMATLGLARWSFERGFLDYVNALEQVRLTSISERVGRLYINNNQQWSHIDPRALQQSLNRIPEKVEGSRRRRPPENRGEPTGPDYFSSMGNARLELEAREGRANRRRFHTPTGRPHWPPTALYDLDGVKIAGHILSGMNGASIDVPVVIDGKVIAMLKSEPMRGVESSIETEFSRQQWQTSIVIGIASLLMAALVSWGLTRLLVSPVQKMIQGVNRLSTGNYDEPLVKTHDDEFGLLVDDINYLSNTLEKNRSARNRWLADISHELRTPLAILTGEVEALKDGIRPFGPAQLLSLDQEIQRLRYLVDDLYQLSLSDIGGLRYEFADIDLADCIRQTITSHQLSAEEKEITITFEAAANVMVSADKKRVGQLLANLIRNSLAYTSAKGRVEVSLQVNNNHALIEIQDTPPGVTIGDCDLLFEPLYRQDESRSRRSAGAGLGLAICRNIVEAHRGVINASPSSLGGLHMMVTLPILSTKGV